jgi:hypothetical protein
MGRVTMLLALAGIGAGLLAASAGANPPFPSSTYNLYAGSAPIGPMIGQLVIPAGGDQPGARLGGGSYVEAGCVAGGPPLFTARIDLAGTPINNPAGVINAFPPPTAMTKIPPDSPGTLSSRFFIRWFPSVASAPTQNPPTGPPGPGQTFSMPPGDVGTGNVSGRNNPTAPGTPGFCSFRLNFFAQKLP